MTGPGRVGALACALACALAGATAAGAQEPGAQEVGQALDRATRRVVDALAPSIVTVEALGELEEEFRAPENPAEAEGGVLTRAGFKQAFGPSTGLVVGADGLVLTTTFVLRRQPRHLLVTLHDGRTFVARPAGRCEARALLLLRIEAKDLAVAPLADAGALEVGRWALALGRGLGGDAPSVTRGIVSALGRVGGRAVQTSAAVSPVSYGGPLAGLDGRVLGLIVPLDLRGGMPGVAVYDSGIGFAIPAPELPALVARLARGEVLRPAFLGVVPDPSHAGGVRVAEVAPGSPAAAAGLAPGDVILAAGDEPVTAPWRLLRALARRAAGDELELEVRRGVASRKVTVRLAAPPARGDTPGEE